jgi:hypothetical protein
VSPDAQRKVLGLSYAVEKQANDLKNEYQGRIEGHAPEGGEIRYLTGVEALAQRTAKTFLEIASALRLIASVDK